MRYVAKGKFPMTLAAWLVALCSAAMGQSPNLVVNPGFEAVKQGEPLNWRFDRAKTDPFGLSDDTRTGKCSVWSQLTNSPSGSWWTEWFAVEPNTTYDVRVWVKVDRPGGSRSVRMAVAFDTHGAPYRSRTLTPGKWHAITDTVRSWPNSTKARVCLQLYKWQGKAWFDDVSFRKSDVDWMDRFKQTDLSRLQLGQGHPCVFFSPAEIEQLRQASWAEAARSSCLASAERLAAESPFRLPDIDFTDRRVAGPGRLYMRGEAERIRRLGFAYQLSRDRKYAQAARERLLACAERLPKGNLSGGGYGYNTGYALHNMAGAYDLVYDSPVFSPADRQRIESMLREGSRGMRRSGDVMRINNRGAICLGAMASIAFCLQDRELIEWAINGSYGFNYHMHKGIGDDGIWTEGVGYGYMALGKPHGYSWNCGYLAVAEAAYHAGIDLYSHPRFKRILDAPLEYAFPDFSLPANGHCAYSASLLGRGRFYLLKPWTRTRDPRYAWLISEQLQRAASGQASSLDLFLLAGANEADFSSAQAQPPPTVGSALFGQIGHAMLRTGRDESQVCVFLDYGPFGSHGNPDKMSLSLYAHDHVLCPDGITGYRYLNTFMYECQTVGHNTVVVDETTQFPTVDRTLNAWLPAPGVKIVDAEDIQAYPGVKLRRSVALTDVYVLDVFAVASDEEHRYDWVYRNFGPLEVSPKLTPRPGTLGVTDGYQYITGVRRGPAEGDWTAEWDLSEMNLVWNSSFEFQTGAAWQIMGWRIPSREWRRYVSVDTDTHRRGKQSLRIELPKGKRESVHLLAAYKRNRFRAGKTYLLEAHVRARDVRPAEGAVGLWVGDQLVGKLSAQDAAAAGERWVKIGGTYNARTTNRDMVKIGLDGIDGGTVWFDDVSLRIREDGTNALRLTVLGCPGTEVITSDGEGLRPFQQALLFARRHAQDTVFACVMEPYYGQPTVQAVRPLAPASAGDRAGIEVVTNRSVDRFLVSYAPGRKTCAGLATDAMIAAVSLDRATDTLRHLCMGRGTSVAAGPWALQTTKPATLHLAASDRAYVLRVWGQYRGRVAITGPDLAADWTVSGLDSDAGAGAKVEASFTGQSMRFGIAGGRAYRLAGSRR